MMGAPCARSIRAICHDLPAGDRKLTWLARTGSSHNPKVVGFTSDASNHQKDADCSRAGISVRFPLSHEITSSIPSLAPTLLALVYPYWSSWTAGPKGTQITRAFQSLGELSRECLGPTQMRSTWKARRVDFGDCGPAQLPRSNTGGQPRDC